MKTHACLLLAVGCLLIAQRPLQGDSLELTNGDSLSGKVVKMDGEHVVLKNDVLGEVRIHREKIARIDFSSNAAAAREPASRPMPSPSDAPATADNRDNGDPQRGPGDARPADPNRPTEAQILKELRSRGLNIRALSELKGKLPPIRLPAGDPAQTPQDVIDRLRREGIRPDELKAVQSQVPLLAVPGVRGYFDKQLSGLMSGEIKLEDIRKDAVKARAGLLDLKKDLGPSGDALNGYLMILEGFLEKTEPPEKKSDAAAPSLDPALEVPSIPTPPSPGS